MMIVTFIIVCLFAFVTAAQPHVDKNNIIPRMHLFNNPKFSAVTISPDGRTLAYLAANRYGISNVYTKCLKCKYPMQVTFENHRHVTGYQWTGVPNIILYYQDNNGDENYRLYKANITNPQRSNKPYTICDMTGVKALIIGNNLRDARILVGLNNDNAAYHNIYEYDLLSDRMRLIFLNRRFPAKIVVDNALRIRMVVEESHDGSLNYYKISESADLDRLTSEGRNWDFYMRVPAEDRILTVPITFTADNEHIYWQWGAGSDLGRLVVHRFSMPNNSEILYTAQRAQISGILFHPTDHTVLAVSEIYHKSEMYVTNNTVLDDMQYLVNLRPAGSPIVEDMSQDFKVWLVSYTSEDQPNEYFVYYRPEKRAEYVFTTRPELHGRRLNRMIGFDYLARDGLRLQAYLSLPPHTPLQPRSKVKIETFDKNMLPYKQSRSKREAEPITTDEAVELSKMQMIPVRPQKLIVLVHGGPKSRDKMGFSPFNAWLTNRGYAVLQVNYRGSVGFGKNLTNAGNGEWGRKMHQDLLDGVDFLVQRGIVDRRHVAIMGGSYGGYATLVGMTFTPNYFACGVDIVGPSNLITLLDTLPPYWKGFYNDLTWMLGADKKKPEGRRYLKSRSPLYFADRVRNPLLVIHGSNDPRVKQSESDQFVGELKRNGIPVTYVLFPDEGHGMQKPQNMLAMAGFVEEFLHECLGGRLEPFKLGQYNSSAQVLSSPLSDNKK